MKQCLDITSMQLVQKHQTCDTTKSIASVRLVSRSSAKAAFVGLTFEKPIGRVGEQIIRTVGVREYRNIAQFSHREGAIDTAVNRKNIIKCNYNQYNDNKPNVDFTTRMQTKRAVWFLQWVHEVAEARPIDCGESGRIFERDDCIHRSISSGQVWYLSGSTPIAALSWWFTTLEKISNFAGIRLYKVNKFLLSISVCA